MVAVTPIKVDPVVLVLTKMFPWFANINYPVVDLPDILIWLRKLVSLSTTSTPSEINDRFCYTIPDIARW